MSGKWFYPSSSCIIRLSSLDLGEKATAEQEMSSDGQDYHATVIIDQSSTRSERSKGPTTRGYQPQ